MRIFKDFPEANGEIIRDLAEMGIEVHTMTYQDKNISQDPEMATLELQNYIYCVTQPDESQLDKVTQPWADAEWDERLQGAMGDSINPGVAWQFRKEVWEQFLEANGKFAYAYPERLALNMQVQRVISRLLIDRPSRQMFMPIFDVADSLNFGTHRVPCSLGYHVQVRHNRLDLTYLMRSCDFVTHFQNDIYLAVKLMKYIAEEVGVKPGFFTHYIASLHIFKKDVKGVF